MRRKWVIGIASAVIVAVLFAIALPGEREPEYQGKKLSEWIARMGQPREAAEAVRAIGPKAVPFLVKWSDSWMPPWKLKLMEKLENHRDWPGSSYLLRQIGDHPEYRIREAHGGFVLLGENGKVAVPDLVRIARNSTNFDGPWLAFRSLAYLGTNGMAALIELANDIKLDQGRRESAIHAMIGVTYLGTNALPCIPVLVKWEAQRKGWVGSGTGPHYHLEVLLAPKPTHALGVNWTNAGPDPVFRLHLMKALADAATNSFCFDLVRPYNDDPDPMIRAEAIRGIAMREAYLRTH